MMPTTSPLVSVIMPAYNAEKTISRAIDSVLNQTYANTELLIINDGSTDGTIDVVGQYKDSRITLINQPNKGPSNARNTGMEYVKGAYISFIDSDDWYDDYYVERLMASITATQSQLAVCGMIAHKKSNTSCSASFDTTYDSFWENADFMSKFQSGIMNSPCNKLYETNIIRKFNLKFRDLIILEDLDFNLRYIECIKKLCFIPHCLYHYDNTYSVLTTKVAPEMFDNYIHIHAWLFSKVPISSFPIVTSFVYHQYVALSVRYMNLYIERKVSRKVVRKVLGNYLSNPLINYSIKTYQSKCLGEKILNILLMYKQINLLIIYMGLLNKWK